MRIPLMLMVQDLDSGGSERQARQFAVALQQQTHFDVHFGFFRPNPAREKELQAAGLRTVEIEARSLISPSIVRPLWKLGRYLRDNRIQVLHSFDNPTAVVGVPVGRLAGTPVVLASQRGNRAIEPAKARRLRRLVDPFAHGFVVNAQALFDHLVRDFGIAPDKIRFCPNGLDTRRFTSEGRARLAGLESATVVIGCVAAQRPDKKLPFLVDAFAELRSLRPGVKLVLVGSGSERPFIEARVEANQLGSDCVLISHTADTAPILRSIDIFVLASTSEGQSNSLMEAMGCGCAVVASNVEGTRDLVRDRFNGFLFEYMNQADLVSKVLALVDDASLLHMTGADASAWIRSTMSIEASTQQMAAIYDEFLARVKS